MSALEQRDLHAASHIPVLLDDLLKIAAPVKGRWLDGTLGAGGYTKALLKAGADHVTGIDRDPSVFRPLRELAEVFEGRVRFVEPMKAILMELFLILACLPCSSIRARVDFPLCAMGRWT